MHSFKFDPPHAHRRSIQPRNEHIHLFNILDKCTQILREDRLFLRGEIKNNNQDIIEIFKQHPKHTQFAQLQMKLRKHVQTMKNKIKNQQLNRFKESLRMKQNSIIAQPKPSPAPTQTRKSSQRLPFKPHQSLQMTKGGTRGHRSVEQQLQSPNHYPGLNNSLRQFQHMLKYRFNQEVIQERQSQNVTSTRQHRENEKTRPCPLQEKHINASYNTHIQPRSSCGKSNYSSLMPNRPFTNKNNFGSSNAVQKVAKPEPWQFQLKAKEAMFNSKPTFEIEIDPVPSYTKAKTFQAQPEDKQQSIFDQCMEESRHIPPDLTTKQQFDNSSHMTPSNCEPSLPSDSHFMLKQSQFDQPSSIPVSGGSSSRESKQENLYTPQQLLAQCRNFLKYREGSMKKSGMIGSLEGTQQIESHVLERVPAPDECIFTRERTHNYESVQESLNEKSPHVEELSQIKQQEKRVGNLSQFQHSHQKKEDSSSKTHQNNYLYTHFETFANQTSKQSIVLPTAAPTYKPQPPKPTLPSDFSIEEFIEDLLQATDLNPFITVAALKNYIRQHPSRLAMEDIFNSYLTVNDEEQACITTLAETVDSTFSSTVRPYPHQDKAICSVYDLLDIDQKGFINKQDIQSFLGQIEQAEIQNFGEVSSQLWKLFDGADFNNEYRLSYWHFYVVKNSEEFDRVKELLGEFEFEIERDN